VWSRRGLLAVALTMAVAVAGCAGQGASGKSGQDAVAQSSTATPSDEASGSPSDETSPSPKVLAQALGPAASASPKAKKPSSPKPAPSRKPIKLVDPPPAPKPEPLPPGTVCPFHEGTDASRAAVKSALVTAANTHFWSGAPITVPVELIKAEAWQESGWQSTIISCDGGIGTMQIMPATATWMNGRFGTSYDEHTLTGNTMIGAAYLEWLIKYFGDVYFQSHYTVDAAACFDETSACLLNAIIASYNVGFGNVDTKAGLVIPTSAYQYVGNVRALMTGCECLAF
jgi:soluble lytic murein transglycosylase-like protein